jgi:benzoylformate decarboxylase
MLHERGGRYLFGNPGHTELTILDRLIDMPEMKYVLALHEGSAMAMADGYAMASGKLGVFCGHIMPGLGNAIGMLFNASKHGTPLLVTAGQQDQGFSLTEPFLWGDLVEQARPFCKWAYEVRGVDEIERAVNRAATLAMTPPTGPVFLSLPKDVMAQEADYSAATPMVSPTLSTAEAGAISQAADALVQAKAPLIIAGDDVGKASAETELERLARLLGAAVYSETASTRFNFPVGSPLYQGSLGRMQRDVLQVLEPSDVIFAAGSEVFTLAAAARTDPMPPEARLIHLSVDPQKLGKNYAASPALWGDPLSTLKALADEVERRQSHDQRRRAEESTAALAAARAGKMEQLAAVAGKRASENPIASVVAMQGVVESAPENAIIVDESATTGIALRGLIARRPLDYYGLKGGGLGWGLPASVGVQLAHPERPVIAIVGDGSAMFSIQSLWSAAHEGTRVVFVICNNGQYRLIKHRLHLYGGGASARAGTYLGSELDNPKIDFVGLAKSLGVRSVRVERASEIRDAMNFAMDGDGPGLIDLVVEGSYPEREAKPTETAAAAE